MLLHASDTLGGAAAARIYRMSVQSAYKLRTGRIGVKSLSRCMALLVCGSTGIAREIGARVTAKLAVVTRSFSSRLIGYHCFPRT